MLLFFAVAALRALAAAIGGCNSRADRGRPK